MYDRFERLMNERHETFSEIARAIGGRASTFTDWRAGRSVPKIDKFEKLAKHFGVSIDYLVTGRDPENYISDTELKLLESFRKLNTIGQEYIDIAKMCWIYGISRSPFAISCAMAPFRVHIIPQK